MAFRDDNEALRASNDALREELEGARAKVARAEELERANDELVRRQAKQERELAALRERLGGHRRTTVVRVALVGAAVAVAVALAVGAAVFERARYATTVAEERARRDHRLRRLEEERADVARGGRSMAELEARLEALRSQQAALPSIEPREPREPRFDPVVRPGRVRSASGAAPVVVGDVCTVTVTPVNRGIFNSHVSVRCGDQELFARPGAGFLTCGLVDGRPSYGEDTTSDVDPRLVLDLEGGRVVVADESGPDWSVEVALR